MKKGENFSASEWAALSAEQQNEVLRSEEAIDKFLADRKTIRYLPTDANQTALLDFLSAHGLDITHPNLLFAFDSLRDTLELIPLVAPVVLPPAPSQPPTPVPTAPDPLAPQMFRNGRPIAFINPQRIG